MKKLFTLFIFLCAALSSSADWYVTGDEGLTELDWQVDGKRMSETFDRSGIYTTQFTVTTAGTYRFKVTNGTWTTAYPGTGYDDNYSVTTSANNVTLTIYFDPQTHAISTTEEAGMHPTYVVVKSDVQPNLYVYSSRDGTDVYQNMEWPGKQMERVTINEETFYLAGPFENFFNPTWSLGLIISNNGDHQTSQTIWKYGDDGAYACEYNSTNGSYVELPTLRGQIPTNDWKIGLPLSYKSSNTYEATATPARTGASYKIVWFGDADKPSWYGYGSDASNITGNGDYTLSTSGNNMQIRLQRPTTFTFNTDTKVLTVATDDTDFSLDYFTATDDGNYDAETHTLTAINNGHWDGINLKVGDVSTTQNDFAVIQTDAAVKLGWWMDYTTGDAVVHNETTASTIHYCPLDADRVLKSLTISLQEAGTVTFSNLSFVDAVATAELKTAAGGYATFSSNEAVAIPEGITAKYPTKVSDKGVITWKKFENGIPAGQGALLEGTLEGNANTTYKFPPAVVSPSTVPDEAKTTVTMEPIASKDLLQQENNGYTKYILSKQSPDSDVVGFFEVNTNGSWVNAGTAYLKVSNDAFSAASTSGGAPAFFPLTGETTAIDNLTTEPAAKGEEKIYSLDGRRIVGQPTAKGIYIVNGKKLLKK